MAGARPPYAAERRHGRIRSRHGVDAGWRLGPRRGVLSGFGQPLRLGRGLGRPRCLCASAGGQRTRCHGHGGGAAVERAEPDPSGAGGGGGADGWVPRLVRAGRRRLRPRRRSPRRRDQLGRCAGAAVMVRQPKPAARRVARRTLAACGLQRHRLSGQPHRHRRHHRRGGRRRGKGRRLVRLGLAPRRPRARPGADPARPHGHFDRDGR